jgi:hypothetical protein
MGTRREDSSDYRRSYSGRSECMKAVSGAWNFFLDMFDGTEDTPGRKTFVILMCLVVLAAVVAVGVAAASGAL